MHLRLRQRPVPELRGLVPAYEGILPGGKAIDWAVGESAGVFHILCFDVGSLGNPIFHFTN